MPFAPFKQGQIFYESRGKGRALVLLHGFLESSLIWESLKQELSKGTNLIVVDLPGHGNSECFGYIHSMELMADAVFTVLKDLNIRKCVIAGHSMGGYVALAFARKYSAYLKGLILFQSTPLSDSEEKKIDRDRVIRIIPKAKDLFLREALPGLFRKEHLQKHPEHLEFLKNIAEKTSIRGMVAALKGMKNRSDSLSFISQFPLPVNFILGSDDSVLPLNIHGEWWKYAIRGHLQILPDCGHIGMLENQKASVRALKKAFVLCHKNPAQKANTKESHT